jgi:hypothetical protein
MVEQGKSRRRAYHWPGEARALVASYLRNDCSGDNPLRSQLGVSELVTSITTLTGHPRDVCFRFVRQLGVGGKKAYKEWTRAEQQRLLDLISLNPPYEVAKLLNRSRGSVYRMLNRLGISAQIGREWFTVYTLAQVLHIGSREVQKWIDSGLLRSRPVETGGLTKSIIDPDDFAEFCKTHGSIVVGRRLCLDRLEFVRSFVFPPRHTELLHVRERGYKHKHADETENAEIESREDDRGIDGSDILHSPGQ